MMRAAFGPNRAAWTGLGAIGFVWAVAVLPAPGSPAAVVISQQVDIAEYQHYEEDLLYTHLGDNRGFGPQHDLARDNILMTLGATGLPTAREPFVYNSTTYYNLVATQTGTDFPTQVYVVGAHFDSVNNPGADDNATGTAMVMELARVLSRHRSARTIKYVLFDREEQGRRGSIAFVSAHSGENIIQAVTADMVGHNSGAYAMDIYGRTTSSAVVNGMASAIMTYGDGLGAFVNLGNYSFSDHWSFESAGIPACVIIERCYTCNTYYHTANDAVNVYPGYLSYPMIEDLVRSVAAYLVDTIDISLWGDADDDADVDPADLAAFRACYGGPVSGACRAFDFDRDNDVDCADWQQFKVAFQNSSGYVPLLDAASFASVLLGIDSSPVDVCMADMNGDGKLNGPDIQAYVDAE